MVAGILDQFGHPLQVPSDRMETIAKLRGQLFKARNDLRASYDAAWMADEQLMRHWASVDYLSPNSANHYLIRRRLRGRSRYEVIENNPYLKGTILTVANDFIGSGPKLQITDKRIKKTAKERIERSYEAWARKTKYRQKLWRLRMAKCIDGEGFKIAYTDRQMDHPVKLNYHVIECDQVTTQGVIGLKLFTPAPPAQKGINEFTKELQQIEVDGVQYDEHEVPTSYFVLRHHPGSIYAHLSLEGNWIPAKYVTHWFRQDRGWLRGIPETTPSLTLCALLRRYTLAVIAAAETGASFSAVLESIAPPSQIPFTDGNGTPLQDDPFDVFPIEKGMFTTLPWGYKLSQLQAVHPMATYDMFVNALLREIVRPLLVPFNLAAGTSKDSNMASAVVDTHIYKEGQRQERFHCEENVLDPDFDLWWAEAIRTEVVLPEVKNFRDLYSETPDHVWRWDRVGLDHTDPEKVATANKIAHDKGFITDRDIQEGVYNRNVEDWKSDMEDQIAFRESIGIPTDSERYTPPPGSDQPTNPDSPAPQNGEGKPSPQKKPGRKTRDSGDEETDPVKASRSRFSRNGHS